MLRGEYTALAVIDALAPELVPKPLKWGNYIVNPPETYFLLEDFRDLNLDLPDATKLARRTAQIHGYTSPNGMFGFDVPTFNGNVRHITDWEPSWSRFFARFLQNTLRIDEEKNGYWLELAMADEQVLTVVVTRLLNVL
jgi:fructosamine-3-kinase